MIITFCFRTINEVDNQILTCDRKGITKKQLKEEEESGSSKFKSRTHANIGI